MLTGRAHSALISNDNVRCAARLQGETKEQPDKSAEMDSDFCWRSVSGRGFPGEAGSFGALCLLSPTWRCRSELRLAHFKSE